MNPLERTGPLTGTRLATPTPAPASFSPFDEYKLILEDTTKLGDRRYLTNNIYLSVNSVLLGALALLVQQGQLTSFLILVISLVVATAGFVVAGQWHKLIVSNRRLLKLRFRELRAFEDHPLFPGTIKIFHKEDTLYPPPPPDQSPKQQSRLGFGIGGIEERLPRMFQILYSLSAILLTVGTIAVRYHWLPVVLQFLGIPQP
jgi:hypothetical protein